MRFTPQNTEGYDAAQLAELNRRFADRCAMAGCDPHENLDLADHIAERLLADVDRENQTAA